MTEAAFPAAATPSDSVRGTGGSAGCILYLLGLFGTCIIIWWGTVSLGWWWQGSEGRAGFGLQGPLIAALPYLSAWAVLTFVSPWKAVLVMLTFPISLSMAWLFGLIIGFMTWFLLGVPGFVCAAVATGGFLMLAQRFDWPIRIRDWAPIHLMGFGLVGLTAASAYFVSLGRVFTPERFWAALVPVMVALFLHAVWSWIRLNHEGRARVSPVRVTVLIASAYLGIGAAFVAAGPGRSLVAWPAAPWHDPILRARNGQWFAAGETIAVRGPRGAETFRVPEGWRARPFGWPAVTSLQLEPLAGTAVEIGPVQIFLTPGFDWLPEAAAEPPLVRPPTIFVRCTAQPPAPAGLVLCRRKPAIRTLAEDPDFLAWDALELEFVLGGGVSGLSVDSYLVFGPALRAACLRGERCSLRLPLAGGGWASFDVAEVELLDIERVRAVSEALLRSAGAAAVAPTREAWPGLR